MDVCAWVGHCFRRTALLIASYCPCAVRHCMGVVSLCYESESSIAMVIDAVKMSLSNIMLTELHNYCLRLASMVRGGDET
jgi:hypothetical protein